MIFETEVVMPALPAGHVARATLDRVGDDATLCGELLAAARRALHPAAGLATEALRPTGTSLAPAERGGRSPRAGGARRTR